MRPGGRRFRRFVPVVRESEVSAVLVEQADEEVLGVHQLGHDVVDFREEGFEADGAGGGLGDAVKRGLKLLGLLPLGEIASDDERALASVHLDGGGAQRDPQEVPGPRLLGAACCFMRGGWRGFGRRFWRCWRGR